MDSNSSSDDSLLSSPRPPTPGRSLLINECQLKKFLVDNNVLGLQEEDFKKANETFPTLVWPIYYR